jgi:predicted MPP superfamily phosphohydrolase
MKNTTRTSSTQSITTLWLSDLHFDRASASQQRRLLDQIANTPSDSVLISGDISTSKHLNEHLALLASASTSRPVYFVMGNHDFYGSSFRAVDTAINALCCRVRNLHHLDGRQIIPLNHNTCLIGHRGWPDARSGYGVHSCLRSPDHREIHDFRGLTRQQSMIRMRELGMASARIIRKILPLALTRFRHVIVLTHTPPFPEAVLYNGAPCSPIHLPHYVNLSAGIAIQAIAKSFPSRRLTVLAGHAHSSSITHIGTNICVRVAHARTGRTGPQEILRLS